MKYHLIPLFAFFITMVANAQNTVTFQINEESGAPLTGATVVIEGTSTGTSTNSEGITRFDNLPNGTVKFEISFIGYEDNRVTLNFPEDNNKIIEIELEEEGEEL